METLKKFAERANANGWNISAELAGICDSLFETVEERLAKLEEPRIVNKEGGYITYLSEHSNSEYDILLARFVDQGNMLKCAHAAQISADTRAEKAESERDGAVLSRDEMQRGYEARIIGLQAGCEDIRAERDALKAKLDALLKAATGMFVGAKNYTRVTTHDYVLQISDNTIKDLVTAIESARQDPTEYSDTPVA